MHDPIIDRLSALGADADRVVLADPADLRHAGTRRNRGRLAAVTLAVLVVLGGTAIGLRPSGQALPPLPGSPSGVSRSPVPPEACETHLASCFPPEVSFYAERLPAPCADTRHPSEATLVRRTTVIEVFMLDAPPPTSTTRAGVTGSTFGPRRVSLHEAGVTASTYGPGGASAYLAEVLQMLARCPSVQRAEHGSAPVTLRYRLVSTGELGGDESVLLSRTYRTDLGEQTFLIALVRRGDTVLAIVDYGRQGVPSPRSGIIRYMTELR